MSPRSRSTSRSYSPSPKRGGQRNSHRYSRDRAYGSRSPSRHPPSPPAVATERRGRYSPDSKSSSRSRHRRRGGTRSHSSSSSSSSSLGCALTIPPNPSRCIGVFGLNIGTTQKKIREIFSKFGPIERIQVVIDAHTGRSRGFCFIYYENMADAKVAKDDCCGLEVDGRRIRVDYSITDRPHSPTPGVYMGSALRNHRDRESDRYRSRRRYPSSSYRRRHYERHRSRSYSPRRSRY